MRSSVGVRMLPTKVGIINTSKRRRPNKSKRDGRRRMTHLTTRHHPRPTIRPLFPIRSVRGTRARSQKRTRPRVVKRSIRPTMTHQNTVRHRYRRLRRQSRHSRHGNGRGSLLLLFIRKLTRLYRSTRRTRRGGIGNHWCVGVSVRHNLFRPLSFYSLIDTPAASR